MDESNYQVAIDRLKERYLNPEGVKHTLLQSILNFKCDATKLSKVESIVNNWANDLSELKNVHSLDVSLELCRELLREILFYRLPADIRLGLIDECKTNYPPLSDIISKLDKVLTRIKIGRDLQDSKTNNQDPKVGAQDSGGQGNKTTFSLNTVQQNQSQNSNYVKKCVFCNSDEHVSSRCIKVTSQDDRELISLKKIVQITVTFAGPKFIRVRIAPKSFAAQILLVQTNMVNMLSLYVLQY